MIYEIHKLGHIFHLCVIVPTQGTMYECITCKIQYAEYIQPYKFSVMFVKRFELSGYNDNTEYITKEIDFIKCSDMIIRNIIE